MNKNVEELKKNEDSIENITVDNNGNEDVNFRNNDNREENKMGTMPVGRLLISMSLPIMISMLVQAAYNIVDSMFVSKLADGEAAITAVSLAFPIQSLMIALGSGMGVGINAILSRSLGEKNYDKANDAAKNGLFITAISYAIFLIVGLFIAKPFMASQTDTTQIAEYGTIYLRICCICSFGMFGQMTFERLLQSTGKTIFTMITQGLGAIINIILDPIFIFGYFGMPKMGVAGAAVATVIGQCCACALALVFNIYINKEINLSFKKFKPDFNMVLNILAIGVPSIVMQAIISVMSYVMNKILGAFSSTAVAVFGIYFKLQSFIFMPVFGLNSGVIPIIAYNYGAGKKSRMIRTLKLSIMAAMIIMLCGLITFQTMPEQLLGIFNASEYMLSIGVPALRIISISFIFAGYCIVCSSIFQAMGNGVFSMLVSILRQIFILLPTAYLFSKIGGVNMIWWCFPCAEIASVTLCTAFLMHTNKKILSKMSE